MPTIRWPRADIIALIGVIIAAVGSVAAVFAVPEFHDAIIGSASDPENGLLSLDPQKRREAVEMLVNSGKPSARVSLEKNLGSPFRDVRILSAIAITKDAPLKALPVRIDALSIPPRSGDSTDKIVWESQRTLERLGSIAVPQLINALSSDDSTVWSNAARLLADMKATEAVEPLMSKLKSERPGPRLDSARQDIVEALGNIGDARAIPTLLSVAQSDKEDEYTQRDAIWSLGKLVEVIQFPASLSW